MGWILLAGSLWFLLFLIDEGSGAPTAIRGGGKKGGKKGRKAETRAADLSQQSQQRAEQQATQQKAQEFQVAQQQQEQAQAEQARLEAKFARTPEEDRLLQELRTSAALPGEELFRQTGPLSDRLLQGLRAQAGLTSEELFRGAGPVSDQLATAIQQRLATPPQIPFESTLAPALQLAQDQVTNFAARRGITGSGLELESLGRAGVDLAIREAQAREQNRLRNQQLVQETLNRAMGLSQFSSGLRQDLLNRAMGVSQFSSGLEREAIGAEADFERLLRNQELQGVDLGERAFQAGLGRGFSAQESGLSQSAQRLAQGEAASNQFSTLGLQALSQREEAARQRNAAIAQALGSAALAGVTGGLGFIPGTAGGFGGAASAGLRSLAGLPVGQSLVEQLLNRQRGFSSLPSLGGAGAQFRGRGGNLSLLGVDEADALSALGYGSQIR